MASKHLQYIDVKAPENVKDGDYPNKWIQKKVEGDFYKVTVSYPKDHRVKDWPGKQWSFLGVDTIDDNPIEYRILKYEILNNGNNLIKKIVYDFERREKGFQNLEDILGRTFVGKGLRSSFTAYSSIPSDAKEIQINIEIEVTSSKGEKALVKESIPLKRSYYKTSFWEGLRP